MKLESKKERFIEKYIVKDSSFYRKALMILVPVVLQNCINQGVNMMDTIMVGKLGEVAISASSLANQYYSLFNILCMGISAAGLVLASQYWGAGEVKTVRRVFDLILQIVIIVGAVFAVATAIAPDKIMGLYTNKEEVDVIAAGAGYLRITALIFLPHGISLVITNVIRSVGNAKLGLYVSIMSFIFNIFCNYVFIFGKFGFPEMGVRGAALGTLCARLVEFAVCAVYMLKIEKHLKYRPTKILVPPTRAMLSEFKRLGLPAVVSDGLLGLAETIISMIIGHMGRNVVSGYAIVTVVTRLCTVAIGGVASASSVVIGQTVGTGEFKRAQKEGWTFLFMSVGIGLLGLILVSTLGVWTIALYEITEETYAVTVAMMDATAIIVFFQAVQSAMSKGILRGGGDTKFLMIADVLFMWCADIPLGYLTGIVLGWNPFWVLIFIKIDNIIKAFWLVHRLASGKWIHKTRKIES